MQRRHFLSALAGLPIAMGLPALARAASPSRLTVLVYLHGGNDAYNTWVPYTDPLYRELRPTLAVPRDAVLKVTPTHGFHPSFAPLAPLFERGELALVQGIGQPGITQQHYRDCEMVFTGANEDEFPVDGWAARGLAKLAGAPDAVADVAAFDLLDIRESDPMGPFRGEKQRVLQIHHPQELVAGRRVTDCVHEANGPGRARLAKGVAPLAPPALRTAFGDDQFGQSVRAGVMLAATDPGLRVLHLTLNGHDGDKHNSVDTHWAQLKWHGDALSRLAKGLVALQSGLEEIGRWNDTLVATYDEFGRSPVENGEGGTHHGSATTHFVMGGRVKGGLYGEAPKLLRVHQIGGPDPVIDTRRLWTTVATRWWGADASGLFTDRHAPLDILRA